MEHLEQLTKVLRYAGLNLTPQILGVVLDPNVTKLIHTLDTKLKATPNLSLDVIDVIVADIQAAAEATAKAEQEAAPKKAAPKKAKLDKV
jgi:hypothetical protein